MENLFKVFIASENIDSMDNGRKPIIASAYLSWI